MTETLNFIIISIVTGVLIALPAALIELLLIKSGVVRNRMVVLILSVMSLVFIKRVWFNELPWGFIAPMIVILSVLGINRGDFWTTMSRGRWWWNREMKNN